MKLLKTVNENVDAGAVGGAVGSGSVASHATPLFADLNRRTQKPKKSKFKRLAADTSITEDAATPDDSNQFDISHVMSKLKSLENREKVDRKDTVSFGLEDDDGSIIRIVVRSDQADSFEQALQSYLSNRDEQEPQDLAEVVFNLKSHFDIVDVTWPEVDEDEETQDMELADPQQGGDQLPGDELAMGDAEGMDLDAGGIDAGGETEEVKSLLSQIIDMMKADADARKAEATARSAEAKAKEASAAHAQILAKVKQEEQFLDMESHNKKQREADREAKRLAQLARWKHEVEQGEDDDTVDLSAASIEDEEQSTPSRKPSSKRVLPIDVARYIAARIKK